MSENELDTIPEKSLDDIKRIVSLTYRNLEKISRIIDNIDKEKRKEMYKSMPGVSGYFDGFYLVGEDGSKYEVPANYAAKSRIVYGDSLKMLDEDGKKIFKQIDKVARKKLEGVLSKKEGKWYLLTDNGTYRISDIAAEFHKAELNDKAYAYVPEDNVRADYAALDSLEKEKTEEKPAPKRSVSKDGKSEAVKSTQAKVVEKSEKEKPQTKPTLEIKKSERKVSPNVENKPKEVKKAQPARPAQPKKEPVKTEKSQKEEPKAEKEFVANIMEDDDLR